MGTPCFHRWEWHPCPWREHAYIVRCCDCGTESYLVTVRVRGAAVDFIHEPYDGGRGHDHTPDTP